MHVRADPLLITCIGQPLPPIHTIRGGSVHTCIPEFRNSGIRGFLYACVQSMSICMCSRNKATSEALKDTFEDPMPCQRISLLKSDASHFWPVERGPTLKDEGRGASHFDRLKEALPLRMRVGAAHVAQGLSRLLPTLTR